MDQLTNIVNYFGGIDLKQTIDFLIAIAIIIFFYIFSSNMSYIIIRIFKRKKEDKPRIKQMPFYVPLKLFFIALGLLLAIHVLGVKDEIMQIGKKIFNIICVILVGKSIAGSFTIESKTMKRVAKKFNVDVEDNRLNFIYKLIRVCIYIITALIIIALLGINLNGLLAGLGVRQCCTYIGSTGHRKKLIWWNDDNCR